MGSSTGGGVPRIMVFRPSIEEMKDFAGYIQHMESQGAHKAGLAKVIPPKEWVPRAAGYDTINLTIPSPIEQVVHGRQGLFQQYNIQKKSMKVEDFKKLAETARYRTPVHFDYEDLERKYWKNISFNPPIYGADVSGSLYDPGINDFNINHLNTVLDLVGNDYGIKIEGVNTAYLYFGMWKTTFAWHTEDMDLYSINYLHFGAPKSWYAIPPEHGRRLERLAAGFFQPSFQLCAAFLRHKMTVISPQILKQYSIPVNKITQEPGEFMITFPFGYHAGFNHGFNCAESTNFASERWVEYGKRALQCVCRKDGVKIGMDVFVRKFQPDRYDLWREGKDVGPHPEDPSRVSAAPPPSKAELSFYKLEGKRQYKSESLEECPSVSKRHPIAKPIIKQEASSEDGSSSSSEADSSSSAESSSDTEVYDIQEPPHPSKRKSESENTSPAKTKPLQIVCQKMSVVPPSMTQHQPQPRKKRKKMKRDGPPLLKPFFDQKLHNSSHVNSYSSLVSQEGPLRLIISKQSSDDSPPRGPSSLFPASLLPLQHSAIAKCGSATPTTGSVLKTEHGANKLSPSLPNVLGSTVPVPELMYYKGAPSTITNANYKEIKSNITHCEAVKAVTTLTPTPARRTDFCPKEFSFGANSSFKPATNNNLLYNNVPYKSEGSKAKCPMAALTHFADERFGENDAKQMQLNVGEQQLKIEKLLQSYETMTPSFKTEPNPSHDSSNPSNCETVSPNFVKSVFQSTESDSDSTVTSMSSVEMSKSQSKIFNLKRIPAWAKDLADMWQHMPNNFEKEIEFNKIHSLMAPHCCICSVFAPFSEKHNKKVKVLPPQSKVLMPGSVFAQKSSNFKSVLDMDTLINCDGTSTLLQCRTCSVCVHAECYGVTQNIQGIWYCDRCLTSARLAECCACSLRGGALKRTVDAVNQKWVHVVCAVLIKDIRFTNITNKDKVDLSGVSQKRRKLTCMYCKKMFESNALYKPRTGLCIQCTAGKCFRAFHVTCGHAAGVHFEVNDWPMQLSIICTRHPKLLPNTKEEKEFNNLSIGDRVIAKSSNGRYYKSDISSVDIRTYISADFEDGTFSENLFPEDIVARDGPPDEPLQIGEFVKIKWTDKKVYAATFKGQREEVKYTVEFGDGTEKQFSRKDIYTLKEELPKKVKSKMAR